MKCPYCAEFKGYKVKGYPIWQQLDRHMEIKHTQQYFSKLNKLVSKYKTKGVL